MSTTRSRLPSYQEIARAVRVRTCEGPPKVECALNSEDHRVGTVRAESPPTVHWTTNGFYYNNGKPRVVSRRGIYRFLKCAYRARIVGFMAMPEWMRIYEQATFASRMALELGVRIHREAMADDRARLRFLLADPEFRDTELKQRAWRWAQER